MATVTRFKGKRLHIEAKGCIINIYEELHNAEGIEVTAIEIIPDNFAGEEWHLDGTRSNRIIKGKKA